MDPLIISQFVSSKLCHDLITPIGAIQNGIELLSEEEHRDDTEMQALITLSVKNAARKLNFFRAVLGSGGDTILMDSPLMHGILKEYLQAHNITLEWPTPAAETSHDHRERHLRRALLNLCALMAETAPWGGAMTLSPAEGSYRLVLTGRLLKLKESVKTELLGQIDTSTLSARNIQNYLCVSHLKRASWQLKDIIQESQGLHVDLVDLVDGQELGLFSE